MWYRFHTHNSGNYTLSTGMWYRFHIGTVLSACPRPEVATRAGSASYIAIGGARRLVKNYPRTMGVALNRVYTQSMHFEHWPTPGLKEFVGSSRL